jgi:hypothetical protein
MSWLIKTEDDKLEIWTDQEYTMMNQKCDYYGAKPHWLVVRQLDSPVENTPYKQPVIVESEEGFIPDLAFT